MVSEMGTRDEGYVSSATLTRSCLLHRSNAVVVSEVQGMGHLSLFLQLVK